MASSQYNVLNEAQELDYLTVVSADITQRKETDVKLIEASHTDKMSGLLNRLGFNSAVKSMLEDTDLEIATNHLHFILIGIDFFKEVNVVFSHRWGDLMLIEIASRIKKYGGKGPIIGRIGGDEFAIVVSSSLSKTFNLDEFIEKLHETISQTVSIA